MTEEVHEKRDWWRVLAWALVGLLLGIAVYQIPAEYRESPTQIAATTMVISGSWAIFAALAALVTTAVSKAPTKTAVPFVHMNIIYSVLTVALTIIGFLGKVFAPLMLLELVPLLAVFWIIRGVGRSEEGIH